MTKVETTTREIEFASSRRFFAGALVVLLSAWFGVSIFIVARMEAGFSLPFFLAMLHAQAFYVCIPLAVWCFASALKRGPLRLAFVGVASLLALFYFLHLAVLVNLDQSLTPAKFFYFSREWRVALVFISWRSILFSSIALAILIVGKVTVSARTSRRFLVLSLLFSAIGALPLSHPSLVDRYAFPFGDLLSEIHPSPDAHGRYSLPFITKSLVKAAVEPRLSLAGRPNVLVVVEESLSAADSYLTSGLDNFTPRLDKLAAKGMIFRNFLVNHNTTEGALIALLQGVPPFSFPGATRFLNHSFAKQHSLVRELADDGYATEFLTAGPLSFINQGAYLGALGFDHVVGRDEAESFRGAARFSFDSPSDRSLFEETIRAVKTLGHGPKPFFLTVLTVSNHLPPIDPLGRANNVENVLDFVDRQIEFLVTELERDRFFENGVLLLFGDHRKMMPMTDREEKRYGDSARVRVPLLAIGRGIPQGIVDDRLFQLSDLLRKLDSISDLRAPLTPYGLSVAYGGFWDVTRSDISAYFLEVLPSDLSRGYRGVVRGTKLKWDVASPNSKEVEEKIHEQRALSQSVVEQRPSCPIYFSGRRIYQSDRPGLLVRSPGDAPPRKSRDAQFSGLKEFVQSQSGAEVASPVDVEVESFLRIDRPGPYVFRIGFDGAACLSADGTVAVFSGDEADRQLAVVNIGAGLVDFRIRLVGKFAKGRPSIEWRSSSQFDWQAIPDEVLFSPVIPSPESSDYANW